MSHEKHSGLLSYVRRGIGEGEFIVKRGRIQTRLSLVIPAYEPGSIREYSACG